MNKTTTKSGMTMTQKILAAGAGLDHISAGQLISAPLDRVLGNDITSPMAIEEFSRLGSSVFNREKITLVMDHFTPNKDIQAAAMCKTCREFAAEQEIDSFFEGGDAGIEHILLPEQGLVTAGDIIIGADSHTCTYGAVGAFSTGVGSTDMAAAMHSGRAWFRVPEAIKIELSGSLRRYACGKDVILHLIGLIGVDGARYQSLEFCGGGVKSLSMSDRLTICNMAIECGAKNGIFPVDDTALEFLAQAGAKPPKIFIADEDAAYSKIIKLDLDDIRPVVAFPHLPSNTRTFDNMPHTPIDQVVIGSCTNGRLEDLAAAAEIFKGRHVKKGVRTIIIPATPKVYRQALDHGLLEVFLSAGALISTPTCGPCLGGHMGILAEGERAVSTTNRNFVGRMGHVKSEVYLASPYVAAASAVCGYIASPEEVMQHE